MVAQTLAKTLRKSVDDTSTLKPSCRRGSRVCKKLSKVEVVKRDHRNVEPRISSHNTCLKDVRGELPIGSVARKISEGSSDVRLECRTRAVRICKAALRHPWIHSPHCSVDGDLRWSCSKCGEKLQSLNGCFPIYRGRNPCATSDPPPVLEERAIVVRDLGLLLPRNSGSAKFRAAPALLAGTKEIEVCRRRTKAFERSCPDCGWCVPEEFPRARLLAKQHAWAHGKVLQTLGRDDFRKQRCEAAAKNSRELLLALWKERRPECAHQLTGGRPRVGRTPPRVLQLVCIVVLFVTKWLHTRPSRLLPCWKAVGFSSQNDPLYTDNYGSLVWICSPRGLRRRWNTTKRDAPVERDVRANEQYTSQLNSFFPTNVKFPGLTAAHTCAHRNPAGRLGRALPGRDQVSLELLVVLFC